MSIPLDMPVGWRRIGDAFVKCLGATAQQNGPNGLPDMMPIGVGGLGYENAVGS